MEHPFGFSFLSVSVALRQLRTRNIERNQIFVGPKTCVTL